MDGRGKPQPDPKGSDFSAVLCGSSRNGYTKVRSLEAFEAFEEEEFDIIKCLDFQLRKFLGVFFCFFPFESLPHLG